MGVGEFVVLLLVGGVLGVLGGLLGIGGGIFAIPLLGIAFGLNEQHAQGTALVMVVPTVAIGLWSYAKKAKMDRRIGFALAAAALPFTFVGAHIATHVPSSSLRLAFAVFALSVGAEGKRRAGAARASLAVCIRDRRIRRFYLRHLQRRRRGFFGAARLVFFS